MNLLHITNNYPTEKNKIFGIFVKEQINALIDLGLHVDVFFINGREKGKIEYLLSIRKLKKLLKNNKYDIIHCHHALSAIIYSLTGSKLPFIVSYQNAPKYELGFFVYKYIYKKANIIILKSDANISGDKIKIIPNGVNIDIFREIGKNNAKQYVGLDKNKKYILFVSSNNIRKQKRYDRYISVLNKIKLLYQDIDIQKLVLFNNDRNDMPYFINSSELLLLTSDYEGSANVVKECMACNIPVVSTPVGDSRQLLKNVYNSYVSNSMNEEEIVNYVKKVIDTNSRTDGRDRLVKLQLDSKSVAKKLLNIYKELL